MPIFVPFSCSAEAVKKDDPASFALSFSPEKTSILAMMTLVHFEI